MCHSGDFLKIVSLVRFQKQNPVMVGFVGCKIWRLKLRARCAAGCADMSCGEGLAQISSSSL